MRFYCLQSTSELFPRDIDQLRCILVLKQLQKQNKWINQPVDLPLSVEEKSLFLYTISVKQINMFQTLSVRLLHEDRFGSQIVKDKQVVLLGDKSVV